MKLRELILKNRSYRRFDESHHIDTNILENIVDLARLSASGANRQPLKYLIYNTPEDCEKIFPSVIWAAYLRDWAGPGIGEKPSAYIIILGDRSITETFGVDHGIAAQSIMLGAAEAGLGGCMIGSIKYEELRNKLGIPDIYEILLVLALGKPVEKVELDDIKNGDIKYWRDNQNVHHVPKRSLKELILKL
ncbi:MAG TPA: nitroreductase family protein [Bacteroidales bacterium]|nr:nitroreductase family protein [Bacteroidales bacterium]HPT22735.1 nitroreductase family protein [Bacteroidales bacterium]